MKSNLLEMSKAKLYLKLTEDEKVHRWVEDDTKNYISTALMTVMDKTMSGDPEVESMTMDDATIWSSTQRWLSKRKDKLKQIICNDWKYCARRKDYGDDYERLVTDLAEQIREEVGGELAEIVATILYKESLFSLCECGDIKNLMENAVGEMKRGKDNAKVLGLFAHITELDPDNHMAYYFQGLINFRTQNYHKAIDDFQNAVELNPTQSEYLNNLAYIYTYVTTDLEKARNYAALALRMSFDDSQQRPACLDTLGWILCLEGKNEEAEKYLSEALQIVRENVESIGVEILQEVLYHNAMALKGIGKVEELKIVKEETLKLNPQSAWAKKVAPL